MNTAQTDSKQVEAIKAHAEFEQECWNQAKRELAYDEISPIAWTKEMETRIIERAQQIKIQRKGK